MKRPETTPPVSEFLILGIIFFDEIDSLLPRRGKSRDSSGVSDRMIAQFLTEMDTCMTAGNIYIIGATNRPDLLDPSILQPGRFDVMIYLGISNDPKTRLSILAAKTRKIKLTPDVTLEDVERSVPLNFTGADLFSFVSAAYTRALHRMREKISEELRQAENSGEHFSSSRDYRKFVDQLPADKKTVVVTKEDFDKALLTVKRSVSDKDLEMYKKFDHRSASN